MRTAKKKIAQKSKVLVTALSGVALLGMTIGYEFTGKFTETKISYPATCTPLSPIPVPEALPAKAGKVQATVPALTTQQSSGSN